MLKQQFGIFIYLYTTNTCTNVCPVKSKITVKGRERSGIFSRGSETLPNNYGSGEYCNLLSSSGVEPWPAKGFWLL